jgi:hypothetical protein
VRFTSTLPAVLFVLIVGSPVHAQVAAAVDETLRVFFDCRGCDFDYIRTEMDYVDWVRDRADADVHILVSTEFTGSGGRAYTIEFIGLNSYAATTDTLTYVSSQDETDDVRREALTRVLSVGMMRYVGMTGLARRMRIDLDPEPGGGGADEAAPVDDPWNAWVFRLSIDGEINGESQQDSRQVGLEVSANRTTEAWKVELGLQSDYEEESFEIDSVTTINSLQRSYEMNLLMVRSISPHVSVGAQASIQSSTFGNEKLALAVAPAIEYNVFPYAESTRRILAIRYGIGVKSFDYQEETIYNQTSETRPAHELLAGYNTRQPWGTTGLSMNFSQYLHDSQKYRVDVSGNADIRLLRGLTLDLRANYARVHDQLSISQRGATTEEILLRQRELQTSYEFRTSVGITYRFGSIFNNVVNPRFRSRFSGGR